MLEGGAADQSFVPSATLGFMKLVVSDLAAAQAFYAGAFGLETVEIIETDAMAEAILRRRGTDKGFSLILYRHKAARRIEVGTAHGPLGLLVRDVDQAYAHALAQGARASRPPFDVGKRRAAFLLDPDGHELELISLRA